MRYNIIWVGILANLIGSIIYISLIGHYGKVATAIAKSTPWILAGVWVIIAVFK